MNLAHLAALSILWMAVFAHPACHSEDGGGGGGGGDEEVEGDGGSPDRPSGAEACRERYLSNSGVECDQTQCDEALVCTSPLDCPLCPYRCTPIPCANDGDCQEAFGDFCDDVEWRCERYITPEDRACVVADVGAPRCGNDSCEESEDCDSCTEDCGFCDGEKPLGEPCEADSECQSGDCYMQGSAGYCTQDCTNEFDCIRDDSSLSASCVFLRGDVGQRYCAVDCGPGDFAEDCDPYPGMVCETFSNTFDAEALGCVAGEGEPEGCTDVEVSCPTQHGAEAGCWPEGTACETVVLCPSGNSACTAGNLAVDCSENVCLEVISGLESSNEACSNGDDDDGNQFTDCDDFHCLINPTVTVCDGESSDAACSNDSDDDGNGFADCDDVACRASPAVTVCPQERTEAQCSNDEDDDGNDFTDCTDFSCNSNPFLTVCP